MEKLVFDYTHCEEPNSWDLDIPFEYESKEKFIFDVLENPILLIEIGLVFLHEFQIEDGSIFEEDCLKNIDKYVFTLNEWFDNNKR